MHPIEYYRSGCFFLMSCNSSKLISCVDLELLFMNVYRLMALNAARICIFIAMLWRNCVAERHLIAQLVESRPISIIDEAILSRNSGVKDSYPYLWVKIAFPIDD